MLHRNIKQRLGNVIDNTIMTQVKYDMKIKCH